MIMGQVVLSTTQNRVADKHGNLVIIRALTDDDVIINTHHHSIFAPSEEVNSCNRYRNWRVEIRVSQIVCTVVAHTEL